MHIVRNFIKSKFSILTLSIIVTTIVIGLYVAPLEVKPQHHNKEKTWEDKNLVVLLTMTIDTKNTITVSRKNVSDRIFDYKKSLTRWAELPYKVVVVENSGYGNPFQNILKKAPNITYISTYIPSDPKRGIGYGEAQTLKYAIDNVITNNSIYIMKVTGRYAPKGDLSNVIAVLKTKNPSA